MTGAWGPQQARPDAAPSEETLLRGARAGERAAVERLYAGHVDWARRVAAIVAGPEAAEALVSETFARAFGQLRAGRGPGASFGPHLLTTMSAVHRSTHGVPAALPADGIDPAAAAAAVAGLPERMRKALWLAEVEARRPEVIAQRLGATPDAAASLVDRARERLRRDYLDQHGAARPAEDRCRRTRKRLGGYVRDDLGRRASAKVADHLVGCTACAQVHAEMALLNTRLAADIFPVVLAGFLGAEDGAAARARALGDLPGRTALTVAASVVAVVAIAATSWGLARHEGEQRTAPKEPDSSGVTFGPNPPAVPPTTSFPTMPEASAPTFASPEVDVPTPSATVPTYPSATYPSATYPSTPYTTSTYGTTPTTPTTPTTTASTSPTTAPETEPTKVWPATPIAKLITRCGRYGSLTLPQTVGVRYTLVVGNGRQGRWVVRARALSGYFIAARAESRFSGNLGRYVSCPKKLAIAGVATTSTGDPATDPWVVKVTPAVPEKEKRALSVTYTFDTEIVATGKRGRGWTCRGPDGVAIGSGAELGFEPGATLACAYGGSAYPPPPVSLKVRALDESGNVVAPSGTVSLLADGALIDSRAFTAVP